MKLFVDTGIFVNVLNKEPGHEKSVALLEKIIQGKFEAFISVVTISEILSIYCKLSEKEAVIAKTYVEEIFGEDRIIPVIKDIAEAVGKIKAKYKVSLGDAFIAAGAIALKCDYLISLDPELKGLDIIKVIEPKDVI